MGTHASRKTQRVHARNAPAPAKRTHGTLSSHSSNRAAPPRRHPAVALGHSCRETSTGRYMPPRTGIRLTCCADRCPPGNAGERSWAGGRAPAHGIRRALLPVPKEMVAENECAEFPRNNSGKSATLIEIPSVPAETITVQPIRTGAAEGQVAAPSSESKAIRRESHGSELTRRANKDALNTRKQGAAPTSRWALTKSGADANTRRLGISPIFRNPGEIRGVFCLESENISETFLTINVLMLLYSM